MASSHGILIEIVGDERQYLRSAQNTISTNTKLDASFKQVGVAANLSADAQIAAAVKAQDALKANALALSARAASLPGGSREQVAATLLAAEAQTKYARSLGVTTTSSRALSGASADAERGIGRAVRGAVAGSGVFHRLGRSVAFASAEFLGLAIGASAIKASIDQAENLVKAQRSLDVAIEHTGGNLRVLAPLYRQTAKDAAQFGVSEVEALTGLARATVLTGDAASAQRAYQEALVISKALGKDFATVLTATAKAQEGSTTSLRRYGILLSTTSTGQEQLDQVMKRFEGQAKANTTATDRLHASAANFEATLGKALLPTVERLAERLGDWLDKMEKSGKLQKDVNEVVSEAGSVFHALGTAVGIVDKVTGSFANTLKILVGLKLVSVLAGWASGFRALAGAEALAAGGAAAIGASGVAARVGMYTGAGAVAGATAGRAGLLSRLGGLGTIALFANAPRAELNYEIRSDGYAYINGNKFQYVGIKTNVKPFQFSILGTPVLPGTTSSTTGSSSTSGFAAGATSIKQWAQFQLTIAEQVAQAQAALTRTTTDDVANAKGIIARIKRAIDAGHLHGQALVQALQAEAAALGVVQSAADAAKADAQAAAAVAAQKRAEAAQRARDRLAAQIQDSIDPLRLEVALSRAEALGKPLTRILKRMRESAQKALASGKLSLEQQREAWDEITSVNQQLQELAAKHEKSARAKAHEYHLANTRELSAGLGLSDAERAVLRARLSQLGPGRHTPDRGVGAYGYEIHGHRPIHVHTSVNLDGRKVASSTTKHQQRRQDRNSSQRRGPNAG